MYRSLNGGTLMACGWNDGATGGVMPLAAKSNNIARSRGSTPGTFVPVSPKIDRIRAGEMRLEASLLCLYLKLFHRLPMNTSLGW